MSSSMKTPLNIFIIDDDEDDKEMFCEVLREINFSSVCHSASGCAQALQLLEKLESIPDIIFLDLNMPKMNGKQCLVKIKQMKRFSTVPVIIYSTTKAQDEIHETQRLGAEGFMIKPNSMRQLKKELENVFDKKWGATIS